MMCHRICLVGKGSQLCTDGTVQGDPGIKIQDPYSFEPPRGKKLCYIYYSKFDRDNI